MLAEMQKDPQNQPGRTLARTFQPDVTKLYAYEHLSLRAQAKQGHNVSLMRTDMHGISFYNVVKLRMSLIFLIHQLSSQ